MMPTVQSLSKQYLNQLASNSPAAMSHYYLSDYSPIVPMIQSGLGNLEVTSICHHRILVKNKLGQNKEVSLDRLVQASKKFGFYEFYGVSISRLIRSIKEKWSPKKSIEWNEATGIVVSKPITRQALYSEYTKVENKLKSSNTFYDVH